jgi:uncharacterized protein (TIGR02391 family)
MPILDELKKLKKERAEEAPFASLLDFEEWSDSAQPLLSFHEAYNRTFQQAVVSAGVSSRMGSTRDANTSMNKAIGIVNKAITTLEIQAKNNPVPQVGFENLLHPRIIKSSLDLYSNGHLRESVLNSITAVFDLIRELTGAQADGDRLIGQVLSLSDPILILSELDSESGQNDQKGFMQIYKGAYQGIRNPKAHSLTHNLNEIKAAQYLVFASLLARRIEEAKKA